MLLASGHARHRAQVRKLARLFGHTARELRTGHTLVLKQRNPSRKLQKHSKTHLDPRTALLRRARIATGALPDVLHLRIAVALGRVRARADDARGRCPHLKTNGNQGYIEGLKVRGQAIDVRVALEACRRRLAAGEAVLRLFKGAQRKPP